MSTNSAPVAAAPTSPTAASEVAPWVWNSDWTVKLEVVSLRTALQRRGFPIEKLQHDALLTTKDHTGVEWIDRIMVGFDPTSSAYLNHGGRVWAFCGGAELFGFGVVRADRYASSYDKGRHEWIADSWGVSVTIQTDKPYRWEGDLVFRLVRHG